MAEPINIQDLIDGRLDIQALGEAANGDENTTVTTRLGETYPSAKRAIKQLFESGGLPATPFTTKALVTASSLDDGDYAMVTDDGVDNGLYIKTEGAWVKSTYDPLRQAKEYVDNAPHSREAYLECAPANLNFDFESNVIRLVGNARLYYGSTSRSVSPTTLDITNAEPSTVYRLTINTVTGKFRFNSHSISSIAENEVVVGYFRKLTHEVWGVDRYVINGRPSFGRYTTGILLGLDNDTINLNTVEKQLEIGENVKVVVDGKPIYTVSSQINVPYSSLNTSVSGVIHFDTVSKNFSVNPFGVTLPESTITLGYLKTKGSILTGIPYYTVDGQSSNQITTENIHDDAVTPDKTNFASLSKNLFDKDSVTHGFTLTVTGELTPMRTRSTTDFIPVKPNTEYTVSHTSASLLAFNENHEPIGGLLVSYPRTTTSLTAYVRLSVLTEDVETFQFVEGSVVPSYKEHNRLEMPNLKVSGTQVVGYYDILSRLAALEDVVFYNKPETLLNFERIDGWSVSSVATSYDGNLHIFGKSTGNTMLYKSQDGGETFEPGMPMSALSEPTDGVIAFTVFEDGTVSIVGRNGQIFHAESFDGTPTLVHTIDTRTLRLATNSFSGDGKQYIFVGGYDHTTDRKQMVVSKDGGRTFELLRNGGTLNSGNNHWHSVIYDPYSDMVWLSEGDGDNSKILYTQDWGVSWDTISGTHPTTMYPFLGRVVFGRDKTGEKPGIDVWDRETGLPVNIKGALTFREDLWSFDVYPTRSDWHSSNPDEYYMLFPTHSGGESYIYGTGDAGKTWHLIYHGQLVNRWVTGVDKNGYVFAGGSTGFFRSKAVKWL